jgi:AhpD family alkylhydroperoxidase
MQSWLDFGNGILKNGLEPSLMELVKIRASQINGCAFCLHMHTAAARKQGETEERLYLLDAWRESPLYSERERAALAWTEASKTDPHRLPHAGVGRGRRGCGPGSIPPLVGHRSRCGAGARSIPAPHRDAPLPRSPEIRAAPA